MSGKNSDVSEKIGHILICVAAFISLITLGLIGIAAFLWSSTAEDMVGQRMILSQDNGLLSLLFLAIAIVIGFFAVDRLSTDWMTARLFVFTIIWYIIVGGLLIFFVRSAPGADAYATLNMGNMLATHDYRFICFPDSYLSYYPHQIGLSVFLEMLIIFLKGIKYHYDYYHAIKIIYVGLNCLSFVCIYFSIKEIWKATRVRTVYAILSIINLPFILYSSFIYGEIPSFTAIAAGSLFLIRLLKEKGLAVINVLLSLLFFTLSVFLRKNSMIFIIAVIIVVILHFLKTKRAELVLFVVLCAILSVTIIPVTLKYFENKAGGKVQSGVTMYSYLAMGMQEGERGPGWYNGYNFDLYKDTGMNTEECNRISHEYIQDRVGYFKNNPKECFKFYRDKFLTQWTDSTLASCQAIYATYIDRKGWVESLFTGKGNKALNGICNVYQNIIMFGAFVWILHAFITLLKKKKTYNVYEYLWVIAVIGGFIFHMIWEANSRYIFTYAMLIIPYAAAGYGNLVGPFIKKDKNED